MIAPNSILLHVLVKGYSIQDTCEHRCWRVFSKRGGKNMNPVFFQGEEVSGSRVHKILKGSFLEFTGFINKNFRRRPKKTSLGFTNFWRPQREVPGGGGFVNPVNPFQHVCLQNWKNNEVDAQGSKYILDDSEIAIENCEVRDLYLFIWYDTEPAMSKEKMSLESCLWEKRSK